MLQNDKCIIWLDIFWQFNLVYQKYSSFIYLTAKKGIEIIMLVNQNKDTYDRKTDEYIVAYIDLLGVTNKIKSKDNQLAMNKLHNLYTFSTKLTQKAQIEENKDIQFKIFSDNIIIAKKLSNMMPQ